jgi:hypothetical protein
VLVVDEQGRVLSDEERIAALRDHGLEESLATEPHAWSLGAPNPAGVECDFRDRSKMDEPEQENTTMNETDRLGIYGIRSYEHRGEMKSSWTQIGVAFRNEDESLTLRFDYIPAWGDVRINVRPIKVQDSEEQQAAEVA